MTRRRLALLTTFAASTALATAAAPALTADSGAVVATVSVAPPPAPCITLSATSVDFGTLELSDPAAASTPIKYASPNPVVRSCATAPEHISLRASAATTASGGTWNVAVADPANTCASGRNVYAPYLRGLLVVRVASVFQHIQSPPFNPGGTANLQLGIKMPCRGSVGAGESVSLTFSLLAVIA